jgi:hypothetical protein
MFEYLVKAIWKPLVILASITGGFGLFFILFYGFSHMLSYFIAFIQDIRGKNCPKWVNRVIK